jgi:hypothetical protein
VAKAKRATGFTASERRELEQKCGLFAEQVEGLEGLLPSLDWEGNKNPSKIDIRDRIQAISKPLIEARASLERLEMAVLVPDSRAPDGTAIRADAPPYAVAVYDAVADFADRIKALADDVANTERELLECFSGRRRAETWRISAILGQLHIGHYQYYKRCDPEKPAPTFTMRVSANGTFAKIASTCYAAAGIKGNSGKDASAAHVRAIRAYVEARKLSAIIFGENSGVIPDKTPKLPKRRGGRPRKLEQ